MPISDRAVTGWAAAGSTAAVVVVGAIAAFGGLAAAPEPELATATAGTPFVSAPLTVTLDDVQLVDAYDPAYLDAETGTRIVTLTLDVVNTWDQPQYAGTDSALYGVVTVPGLPDPDAVVRADDEIEYPALQPGVPVRLVMAWRVDADRYAHADHLGVTLSDMSLYTASFVTTGHWWTDPVATATAQVPIVTSDR